MYFFLNRFPVFLLRLALRQVQEKQLLKAMADFEGETVPESFF